MSTLILASVASGNPMGAEVYQDEVATRAADALAQGEGQPWAVRRFSVTSLRSPLRADRRLPMGRLSRASATARAAVGAAIYPRHQVLHRMNLELPPGRAGNVVTLHDVVAWRFPDESAPVAAATQELARADAVIAVSEFTAQEAADLLGLRGVHVVPNGVDERFLSPVPLDDPVLSGLGIQGRFVLTAGGASARKNLALLARAWPLVAAARPGVSLVLVGPEHPHRTQLFAGMPGVVLTGRVPAELVPRLMARAAAIVVPSAYEGFGLPALEGMAAGSPVVAARTSSLPEVVGDGGMLVDPRPEALAQGLIDALDGGPDVRAMVERGRTRAAEFTWARSAQEHARVWAEVNGRRLGGAGGTSG